MRSLWSDCRAELDEKAILIGLFVVVAMVGLGVIGSAVANLWSNVAASF
jgi:hypothetical protein